MMRRGYPTHENATPDPEPSDFAKALRESSLHPKHVGLVERISPTADRPRRVYFTDAKGIRWRVYDVSFGPPEGKPGEEKHFPPPYPPAKARVFIAANGDRRSFSFNDRQAHEAIKRPLLTRVIVSAQFSFAGYPESTDEEERDPRRDFTVLPPSKWVPSEHHTQRHKISTLNRWTAYDAD